MNIKKHEANVNFTPTPFIPDPIYSDPIYVSYVKQQCVSYLQSANYGFHWSNGPTKVG